MKTFTSLIGTTAITSPTTYGGAFTTLTNNNSAQAVAVASSITNDQHRQLLQRYFDNERTVTLSTVGSKNYTATVAPVNGATSATLTASYVGTTGYQYTNFSDGEQRNVLYTSGSTAVSWAVALVVTAGVTLTTTLNALGIQYYNIPADCSKIKNSTINVGQLKYQPIFISSRQEWDTLNFLPYNSDIPNYAFIYQGQIGIFPIPSTTGNIITFNYKCRVPDFTFQDYSTGNVTGMTAGSTTVTGTATSWNATGKFPTGVNVAFWNLFLRVDPPYGDGMWYPITQFNSDTSLTLGLPVVNAPNITAGSTYTIGQMPLLHEDFHDMIVYGGLKIYYTTIVKDSDRFQQYDVLYKERMELLKEYDGTKQVNVDLESDPAVINPNLFLFKSSS